MFSLMKPSSNSKNGRTTLQTAARALEVLEFVAEQETPPTLKEMSTQLGINITTCYHLFNTLNEMNYLVRDEAGGLRIGARAALLYRGFVRHHSVAREHSAILAELSATTRETAYLNGLLNDEVVIQEVVEGTQAVRVSGLHVGFAGDEHRRASGKAILAFLDADERDRILDHALQHVPKEEARRLRASLVQEFEAIRRQGWAFDDREFDASIRCAAAPIFDADGRVFGSVAVSMPASRFRDSLVKDVVVAADQASQALGSTRRLEDTLLSGER